MQNRSPTIRIHDIATALLIGLIFTIFSAWFVSPHLIVSSTQTPYIAPNFGDYCEYLGLWDVQHIRQIDPQEIGTDVEAIDFMHPGRRTMLASIPSRLFVSSLGVVDGLGAGALLCSVAFAAGLYLWASALTSRLIGVLSVIAALCTGSLCLISRHFTFYPSIVACFTLSAAATSIAMRNQNRSGAGYLIAGLCIGASLLVDVRGLIWVGIFIPFLVLSSLFQKKLRYKLRNILLLLLPIWASFQLGSWNTGRLLPMSLEEQVDIRPLAYTQGATTPDFSPPYSYPNGYSWGNSPISALPQTAEFLYEQLQMDLPDSVVKLRKLETRIYDKHVRIWEQISLVCIFISLVALRKDRWALCTLIITGIPYVAAQMGIHTQHEFRVRFLFHTLPFSSVLIAISVGFVLRLMRKILTVVGFEDFKRSRLSMGERIVLGTLLGFVVLNASGIVSGPLHPTAQWRGGTWLIGHGHISNLRALVSDMGKEERLDHDPWSNAYGLSKRWVFRNQTCIPKLLESTKEDVFQTSLYPQLESNVVLVQPSQGLAPGLASPNPTQSLPPLNGVQGLPPLQGAQGLPPLQGQPTQPAQFEPAK